MALVGVGHVSRYYICFILDKKEIHNSYTTMKHFGFMTILFSTLYLGRWLFPVSKHINNRLVSFLSIRVLLCGI